MRRASQAIESIFWTAFAGAIAILARTSGMELPYALVIVAVGLGLSLLLRFFKTNETAKNSIHILAAILWFLFYFGVGYPNTLRASGDRPISLVLLLLLIAGFPLLVLLPIVWLKKRTKPQIGSEP